ncbi:MAG: SMC family ATPase [Candidatus Methanoperedens sp.]|nr:SMC family ATPase [Candidatus Methanoperedens sp.]
MLIKSLELKNIKSYSNETIDFFEGINGICGENGHGKTTILEAIGFVLFDFLPFNNADFLRHGEKSGVVSVTVEGKDEVEYTISRKIGSGSDYFIRTPVGEIKGKKDVQAWLAGNLFRSIKSEEELPSLFENAIGVPQGTFTTAFLEAARNRKIIFDNILKVEEYKTAFDNLLPVVNAIKKTIEEIEREIIPLATRTEKYPELKTEKESMQTEIDRLKKEINEINIRISALALKKKDLTEKKAQLDALNTQIANERIHLAGLSNQLQKARSDLARAKSAKDVINELDTTEKKFHKETGKLKELNTSRVGRDKLKDKYAKIELEISRLNEKNERIKILSIENEGLEEGEKLLIPKIEAARQLEESIQFLQKELKDPMTDIISRLSNLREKSALIENMKQEIERQNQKISTLLPLKNKQVELENRIKELKDIEKSLMNLSQEISALREKEVLAEKLRDEIIRLEARKNELSPAMENQKALSDEIKKLSTLLESLTAINFQLKTAHEKEGRAKTIKAEITKLETEITSLMPLAEKQIALEQTHQELNSKHAVVKSSITQTKKNMKLAGTQGICPILNGVKCSSVSDFNKYFIDEIDLKNRELEELETSLENNKKELDKLDDPQKKTQEKLVLIASRKKDLELYKEIEKELDSIREKLDSLSSSTGALTGSDEELKEISQNLRSRKKEFDDLTKSVTEFQNITALAGSKNKDLEDLTDIPSGLIGLQEKLAAINEKFNLDIEINSVNNHLDTVVSEIKSSEKDLKYLNNPVQQIAIIENLIASKRSDIESHKDIPQLIDDCLNQLDELNLKFHLKESLKGEKGEIELVDKLIYEKEQELKSLASPDKQFDALNENIKKNLKELKTLEKVPELRDSTNKERDALIQNLSKFEGLDENIASVEEIINKLESLHNKYLQALPLASKFDEYTQETLGFENTIAVTGASLKKLINNHEAISKEFRESDLDETTIKLDDLGKSASGMMEAVKQNNKNLQKIAKELLLMEGILIKIKENQRNLEKEKDFLSFSNFIRDTIKSSSEFVINEFIGEISSEANNIYCEIMDDHSASLKWANDYDIRIESGGEICTFKQLSGGERMSAALSVRLALLKSLSNCDFVFLDEPTQNMDEIRRENLSEQITKIKGFKQVFVISHDDTFNEKYSHVIKVQKINGESRVESCLT